LKTLILMSIFLSGCAAKSIHIHSNSFGSVNLNGRNICPVTPETPCIIKMKMEDTTQMTITVINEQNYFSKIFVLNGRMFSIDTTLEARF